MLEEVERAFRRGEVQAVVRAGEVQRTAEFAGAVGHGVRGRRGEPLQGLECTQENGAAFSDDIDAHIGAHGVDVERAGFHAQGAGGVGGTPRVVGGGVVLHKVGFGFHNDAGEDFSGRKVVPEFLAEEGAGEASGRLVKEGG